MDKNVKMILLFIITIVIGVVVIKFTIQNFWPLLFMGVAYIVGYIDTNVGQKFEYYINISILSERKTLLNAQKLHLNLLKFKISWPMVLYSQHSKKIDNF